VKTWMQNLGMERGEAIEHKMVTNAIEKAQRKVEGRNFDARKQLLEYDDVANDQRQMIYRQRNDLMDSDDVSETIREIRGEIVNGVIDNAIPPQSLEEQWDVEGLEQSCQTEFACRLPIAQWLDEDSELHEDSLREKITQVVEAEYRAKEETVGPDMRIFEKQIMLQILDNLWKEHLAAMDYLRQGIGLRAYAQKQPKQEYKREAFELFEELLQNIKFEVVTFLSKVQFNQSSDVEEVERKRREREAKQQLRFQKAASGGMSEGADGEDPQVPFIRREKKVGRNEPCPCGSGRKYKVCHGRLT
jgi:preprotein translocase subunit SecA